MLAGDDLQSNAAVLLFKFVHRHNHRAAGRVVDVRALFAKAGQHHEMAAVPEQNAGQGDLRLQAVHAVAEALALHAEAARTPDDAHRAHAIAGNAQLRAHPGQGQPLAVIRQDHAQAGSAAFQRFHLHDHRHLLRDKAPHHRFLHPPPPQFIRKSKGRVSVSTISRVTTPSGQMLGSRSILISTL